MTLLGVKNAIVVPCYIPETDQVREIREQGGHFFQDMWIKCVGKHYPGEAPETYLTPWDALDQWEQECTIVTYEMVQHVVWTTWQKSSLNREQKGRFVHTCWLAQLRKYVPHPNASDNADWEQLSEWQQVVYADLFDYIYDFQEAAASIPTYYINSRSWSNH